MHRSGIRQALSKGSDTRVIGANVRTYIKRQRLNKGPKSSLLYTSATLFKSMELYWHDRRFSLALQTMRQRAENKGVYF